MIFIAEVFKEYLWNLDLDISIQEAESEITFFRTSFYLYPKVEGLRECYLKRARNHSYLFG